MKKILILCSAIALLYGCKKSSSCPAPALTANTIGPGIVSVNATTGTYGFTEAEYGRNGFTRGTGTTVTLGSYGGNITGLAVGTYDVYMRGNCNGNSFSSWAGPVSFAILTSNTSCNPPESLTATPGTGYISLNWNDPQSSGTGLYEVQYGPTGFAAGTGTDAVTSNYYYTNGTFTNGTAYDFIVRSKCADNTWSAWSSPKSFVSNQNTVVCSAPSQLTNTVSYTPAGPSQVAITWSANGLTSFEIALLPAGGTPTTGTTDNFDHITYSSLSHGNYDFYVRGRCNGGTTAWVGPTSFTY